uniref:Metalloendopeptidase n=1 Tax=Rhabditophanes sp. KR3021 TaxID=114890 RepID=A0AC35U4N0_9BILA
MIQIYSKIKCSLLVICLILLSDGVLSQLSSVHYYSLSPENKEHQAAWLNSGKFQGDIAGVSESMLKSPQNAMFNALKNKQLRWPNGHIPYVLDMAFTQSEVNELEKSFATYRKSTCVRFIERTNEKDYLNIVKGFGCYSQVGRTGGKQELSLGRGCLFHEIIIHELMHSVGFWHEHSRFDRDEHIKIVWENILPGMKSQFDVISPALQDTQGESYDYKSIMHYDSTAFSRNGKNTIETSVDGFTNVIGSSTEFSKHDIIKINKLYKCPGGIPTTTPAPYDSNSLYNLKKTGESKTRPNESDGSEEAATVSPTCQDHFIDCPSFKNYCKRASFYYVMKSYCPMSCGHCRV